MPALTHCSFCGKDHLSAKKFIAGPGVYICDACVLVCKQIIDKELTPETPSPPNAVPPDPCPVKFECFPISHALDESHLSAVAAFVADIPKENLIAITTLTGRSVIVWYRSECAASKTAEL